MDTLISDTKTVKEEDYSKWIAKVWSAAKWPVFTAIVRTGKSFFLRVRDSEDDIKLFDCKDVPKAIILRQNSIVKLYETDRLFASYIDRR